MAKKEQLKNILFFFFIYIKIEVLTNNKKSNVILIKEYNEIKIVSLLRRK